jgi:uncharacterized BrkB/YihY/UPF0761 family membrane protein
MMEPYYDKMLRFNVEHFRQLILLWGIGLVLVLTFFLSYLPMKRPRDPRTYQPEEAPRWRSWRDNWSYMPWILTLTYIVIFIYSVLQIVLKSIHPPNY